MYSLQSHLKSGNRDNASKVVYEAQMSSIMPKDLRRWTMPAPLKEETGTYSTS